MNIYLIRISQTRIGDAQCRDAEKLSATGSQLNVVAVVVMHTSLRQHSVVLDLALSVKQSTLLNTLTRHKETQLVLSTC